jgi:EAL domain-containing protein (putative c-di-GMP-specific phosphodiesterase class I)
MISQKNYSPLSCEDCASGKVLGFDFTHAFQPIVDVKNKNIYAHEALIRGLNQESAGSILGQVDEDNRYRFDQVCRVKAIKLAKKLGIQEKLSINFLPNAVYKPETCIRATLEALKTYDFPVDRVIFEITEGEKILDRAHLKSIITEYQRLGFLTAFDDFGAGYSGLNLLADLQPDIIKLDMELTRGIDHNRARQAIVNGIVQTCWGLSIELIAEGIETRDEMAALQDMGIYLFQGYYFARPAFQALAPVPPELFKV